MALSLEDIKQVFFHCNHTDPHGHYANEVDVLEFGQKIAAFALAQRKPMTEDEIVDFMINVDIKENGNSLMNRVTSMVRAVERFHGIK